MTAASRTGRKRRSNREGEERKRRQRPEFQIPSVSLAPDGALFLSILKWLCFSAIVIFIYLQLSGNRQSSTSFASMSSAVSAGAELSKMQEADNQMIRRLYGIDPADYDGVMLYYPMTNMGAEELFLVKLKDMSQQSAVREAIQARLDSQINSFEGYGIEQSAMLKRSIVDVKGNYALFISADNPNVVHSAFEKAF